MQRNVMRDLPEDDPELKIERKAAAVAVMSANQDDPVDRIIRHHSSWYPLKKCTLWILRYRQKLLQACRKRKEGVAKPLVIEKAEPISLEEMKSSEKEILKFVQKGSFKEEMSCLLSKKGKDKITIEENIKRSPHLVRKSSPIYKIHPVQVDELLCVGGRLRHALILEEAKHPVLLPKKHHVVELIVRHYHLISGHSGKEHVLLLLRDKFWIIKVRTSM